MSTNKKDWFIILAVITAVALIAVSWVVIAVMTSEIGEREEIRIYTELLELG